jgi:hypothetical protein
MMLVVLKVATLGWFKVGLTAGLSLVAALS